jgi:hypothetical protein
MRLPEQGRRHWTQVLVNLNRPPGAYPGFPPFTPPPLLSMIVIVRTGQHELVKAPQNEEQAWELADQLTRETGVLHRPYRI